MPRVVYDCHYSAERKKLNKILGIAPESEQANYQDEIGHSGAAQSLFMLAAALDDARPGDKILVLSFGSGCDALYFEATPCDCRPETWQCRHGAGRQSGS